MTSDESSLFEQALKNLVRYEYIGNVRAEKTTFCILDAPSVKDTMQAKSYDADKAALGIKRQLAVDTQGLPHVA